MVTVHTKKYYSFAYLSGQKKKKKLKHKTRGRERGHDQTVPWLLTGLKDVAVDNYCTKTNYIFILVTFWFCECA